MDSFDSEDENKLEYTQIHEAYMFLLEQLIDAKLEVVYSDEQIASFYQHFKENFEVYN